MTTEPKPRGRPRGSRNRPKEDPADLLPSNTIHGVTGYWTPEQGLSPFVTGDTTTKVILAFRVNASQIEEEEVDWPVGWRLPQMGESIQFREGWGRIVQTIDFDLERNRPIIRLR